LAGAGVLSVFLGRWLTLAADSLATRTADLRPVSSMTVSTGSIRVGKQSLETGPEFRPRMADGFASVDRNGRRFALGPVRNANGGEFDVSVEPGDEVALRVSLSFLPWPTPLDLNFITGVSPSWKRHRYYTLSWKKRGGETLVVRWRFEQWRYSGGWGGDMHSRNPTGLIGVKLRR
jgi:hypothetical protein